MLNPIREWIPQGWRGGEDEAGKHQNKLSLDLIAENSELSRKVRELEVCTGMIIEFVYLRVEIEFIYLLSALTAHMTT